MESIAKAQFKCPKCSTVGEIDVPRAEIIVGNVFLTAIWPVTHMICAGCQQDMSLMVTGIALQGIQWGIRETPPKAQPSKIIVPFPTIPPLNTLKR